MSNMLTVNIHSTKEYVSLSPTKSLSYDEAFRNLYNYLEVLTNNNNSRKLIAEKKNYKSKITIIENYTQCWSYEKLAAMKGFVSDARNTEFVKQWRLDRIYTLFRRLYFSGSFIFIFLMKLADSSKEEKDFCAWLHSAALI